uniref:Uncharacterized protein n=1 Tax=Anguilla anguilla TaxID=7936 RepID=A0A0E9R2P4_ANGAN
MAWQLQVSGNG